MIWLFYICSSYHIIMHIDMFTTLLYCLYSFCTHFNLISIAASPDKLTTTNVTTINKTNDHMRTYASWYRSWDQSSNSNSINIEIRYTILALRIYIANNFLYYWIFILYICCYVTICSLILASLWTSTNKYKERKNINNGFLMLTFLLLIHLFVFIC
jgi:hypothetical protein